MKLHRPYRVHPASLLAPLLLACSSAPTGSSNATGTGGDAGPPPCQGACNGTGNDAGTGTDAGGNEDTGTGMDAAYQGIVGFEAISDPTGANPTVYGAGAGFFPSSENILAEYDNGCSYVAGAPPAPNSTANAGSIVLGDGMMSLGTLGYDSTMGYYLNALNAWSPADSLNASAGGDLVGAFMGSTSAPAAVESVTIAGGALGSSPVDVSVGSGTTVTWNGGAANIVHVEINATNGAVTIGTIYCNAPDSTGSISVPASLVQNFSVGQTGVLSVSRIYYSKVNAANAMVLVAGLSTVGGSVNYVQ
jgi:hypothetical protein